MLRKILVGVVVLALSHGVWNLPGAWGQPNLDIPLDVPNFGNPLEDERGDKVTASAYFTKPDAQGKAQLLITAEMAPGWHIYSITQKGGTITTALRLPGDSSQFKVVSSFTPDPPPKVHPSAEYPGVMAEEHSERVTWKATVEIGSGVDPEKLEIPGAVYAQACKQSCVPPKEYKFVARMEKPAVVARPGQPKIDANVKIDGRFESGTIVAGGTARLQITATPGPGYHLYAMSDKPAAVGTSKPVVVSLQLPPGWTAGEATASALPTEHKTESGEIQRYHEKPISWTVEIRTPRDAKPGEYPLQGLIGYQVCSDSRCDRPTGSRFEATVQIGAQRSGAAPLVFSDANYAQAADAKGVLAVRYPTATSSPTTDPSSSSLVGTLAFAFLGGFILNFMPCVLPVISLKLFAFMQQSGQSRGRIMTLNLWYTAGVICVFLLLATAASAVHIGLSSEKFKWGEQFTKPGFVVAISSLVFVFALSFLGVWEIPLPGFVGTGKAADLAAQEGPSGAFAKGVISTVLATPCSGPFLGPVFAFALAQPVSVIYLFFAIIGLGMASPYLVIGAFPHLIRLLPKPGAWMDTFKQVMGFFMLAAVAFLFTNLTDHYPAATFTLFVGLWFWCWWIGHTPFTATSAAKARAWIGGGVIAAAVGWVAFVGLAPGKALLPWQPFTKATLAKLQSEGKTVMVDFTANWCPTCKYNLYTAINRQAVLDKVNANGVVPLLADWTKENEEIKQTLDTLNSETIPVFAVYPAGKPEKPIVLRDLISLQQVLDALNEAGPSKPAAMAARD